MHSALFNTCLHFFQRTESLRLVSLCFARPNIDLAEQKFCLHFPSLSALDQLKSFGIIRRSDLRGCHWRISRGAVCQKGSGSNQRAQNRWDGDSEALIQLQISRPECWNRPWFCFLRSRSSDKIEVEHHGTYSASAYLMAGKTYSKCGQRLQALFLFAFIRHPQIPSSVGVWGNGLECWCQRYHGWERNAYFRVPLSLQCLWIYWWVWVLLICPLAPSSSVSLIQCNNTGNPWAGKSRAGWGQFCIITRLRLQIKTKCISLRAERNVKVARSVKTLQSGHQN